MEENNLKISLALYIRLEFNHTITKDSYPVIIFTTIFWTCPVHRSAIINAYQ